MDKRKKRLLTILFVVLNVAVVAYTAFNEFGGGAKGNAFPRLTGKSALYFLCAAGCLVVLFAAESTKYVLMGHAVGEKISYRTAFETAAIGKYYDCITPSGAGGQPFQIYWLCNRGCSGGAASAMEVVSFIMMQSGFILLALAGLIFMPSACPEALRVTACVGLVAYSLLPALLVASYYFPGAVKKLVNGSIRLGARLHLVKSPDRATAYMAEKLNDFHESYATLAGRKLLLITLQILSLIFTAALCSIPYFVLMAFGGTYSYLGLMATTVLIYCAVAIVPTPGNAGAAEGTFYLVFSSMDSAGVFWAMLIWRLFSYYAFIAVGGAVYGFNALTAKRKPQEVPEG